MGWGIVVAAPSPGGAVAGYLVLLCMLGLPVFIVALIVGVFRVHRQYAALTQAALYLGGDTCPLVPAYESNELVSEGAGQFVRVNVDDRALELRVPHTFGPGFRASAALSPPLSPPLSIVRRGDLTARFPAVTGDPAFDAAFEVPGPPGGPAALLADPLLRSGLLDLGILSVRGEGAKLTVVAPRSSTAEDLAKVAILTRRLARALDGG